MKLHRLYGDVSSFCEPLKVDKIEATLGYGMDSWRMGFGIGMRYAVLFSEPVCLHSPRPEFGFIICFG